MAQTTDRVSRTPSSDADTPSPQLREVDLDTFFRPRSVAVIGATDTPRKPATAMWRKLRTWGEQFGATVAPVNPTRADVDGVPCVPSIADVPSTGPVDLAVILVGDAMTAFEQAAAAGARFAVIFAAGFAEVGGAGVGLQQRLADLVAASDTHLLGPNTNLNAFETFRDDLPGQRLCLITQSGHQGRPLFQAQDIGFAMSHFAISGGTGAHMADLCADAGLRLPPLSPETQAELRRHIPDYLRVSNPVDNGGAPSGDERGRKILDAIVADPEVDAVVVPITGALASMSERFTHDLVEAQRTTGKPIFVVWGSPLFEDCYSDVLAPGGLPVFRTFRNCVTAARAWFDYWEVHERWRSPFAAAGPGPSAVSAAAAADVGRLLRPGATLSEHESKAVLAASGIPVTREVLCSSPEAAVAALGELGGPAVVKIAAPGIAHKSDLGLVRLGVDTPEAMRRCWDDFLAIAEAQPGSGEVEGVLVCETAPAGVETMVGMSCDELFGPAVAFGLGGTLVEVFDDVAVRVPPFGAAEHAA